MPPMHWTDWAILFVLAFSTFTAFLRGVLLEVFSLAGLILGIFIAGWQYENFASLWVRLGMSRNLADAIAFLLITFGVAIAVSLIGKVLRSVVHGVGLGWVDRLLGAVFGMLRGAAIVIIAVMVIAAFFPGTLWIRDSKLLPYFLQASRPVEQWFPASMRDKLHAGRVWNDSANSPAR